MTEEQISEIKRVQAEKAAEHRNHAARTSQLSEKLNNLYEKCDHKNPDGSSAIEGSMFMLSCKICNWCDL